MYVNMICLNSATPCVANTSVPPPALAATKCCPTQVIGQLCFAKSQLLGRAFQSF